MTKKKPGKRAGASAEAAPDAAASLVLPMNGLNLSQPGEKKVASNATTKAAPGSSTSSAPTPSSDASASYFNQFKNFQQDVDTGFIKQFNALAVHEGWSKKEKSRRRAEAVEYELEHLFGNDPSDLSKWHELCTIVGVDTEGLTSITKYKKALGAPKVRVNLINLVDHVKNGTPLLKFKNFAEFRKYTLNPKRRIDRNKAKQDGFIKVFLRKMF